MAETLLIDWDLLSNLRAKEWLTIMKASQKIWIHPNTLHKLENEKVKKINKITLFKISNFYNVDPYSLIKDNRKAINWYFIKELRIRDKLNLTQTAEEIWIDKKILYKVENNIFTRVPVNELYKIAEFFNMQPKHLLKTLPERTEFEKIIDHTNLDFCEEMQIEIILNSPEKWYLQEELEEILGDDYLYIKNKYYSEQELKEIEKVSARLS